MESKKFYWLKLKKDFFKRHDIRIIEGSPNGTEICLFYLKLMLESIDHEGNLRFSDALPYSSEMLSVITCTELEIVEEGLEVLETLGLLEQTDDGTFFLPKVVSMIGSASNSDEARRAKRYREKKKAERDELSHENVTAVTESVTNSNESKSKSKSKRQSKSKESIERKTPSFTIPTVEEVRAYCQERGNSIDPEAFVAFYDSKGWKVGREPMRNWKSAVITWEKRSKPVKKEETFADLIEKWEEEDG